MFKKLIPVIALALIAGPAFAQSTAPAATPAATPAASSSSSSDSSKSATAKPKKQARSRRSSPPPCVMGGLGFGRAGL